MLERQARPSLRTPVGGEAWGGRCTKGEEEAHDGDGPGEAFETQEEAALLERTPIFPARQQDLVKLSCPGSVAPPVVGGWLWLTAAFLGHAVVMDVRASAFAVLLRRMPRGRVRARHTEHQATHTASFLSS